MSNLINPESQPTDAHFFLEDLINDILASSAGTERGVDEVENIQVEKSAHPSAPQRRLVSSERNKSASDLSSPSLSDGKENMETRRYVRELQTAVNLLRGTSKDFKQMAERVYATPWESTEGERMRLSNE